VYKWYNYVYNRYEINNTTNGFLWR